MSADFKLKELTETIIGAAFKVHNTLGAGFLEKVYENALCLDLRNAGLHVEQQRAIPVCYAGEIVGDYIADAVVNDVLILEIKAVSNLDKTHEVQLVNYLKATGIEVGLLINFGGSVEVRRRILSHKHLAKSV
ncbi:MAG: GxxExxY protein [Verrucomicrobia bacterium]|nr:MAG: GxxExxY protein [Verrucomicrobiota bacterium]